MITLRPYIAKTMSADNIVRIDEGHSPFHTKQTAAYHPERGSCFFYGDDRYQFFFYLHVRSEQGGAIFTVTDATTGRLEGSSPQIAAADLEGIERNIGYLLRERNLSAPAEFAPAGHRPQKVVFSWKL